MSDLLNAFDFVLKNIHVAGWVCIMTIAVRLSWKASELFKDIKDAKNTLNTLATNHLPHLQESLNNLSDQVPLLEKGITVLNADIRETGKEIQGMRSDLLQFLFSVAKKD